jgi:hypothetical protein
LGSNIRVAEETDIYNKDATLVHKTAKYFNSSDPIALF